MSITVLSASTKVGTAAIRALLDIAGPKEHINGLYRDPSKAPREFTQHPNFHAVKGTIADASSLDFSNTTTLLAILPPIIKSDTPLEDVKQMCHNVADKLTSPTHAVQRLVLLSSIGAEFSSGTGELLTNHVSEQIIAGHAVAQLVRETTILRAAYFMENFDLSHISTSTGGEFFTPLTPTDYKIPMVAVRDIGTILAQNLTGEWRGQPGSGQPWIADLWGPRDQSPEDVRRVLQDLMQRPDARVEMRAVGKEQLGEFFGQVFSPRVAELFVEMTTSILPGGIAAMDAEGRDRTRETLRGETSLEECLKNALA